MEETNMQGFKAISVNNPWTTWLPLIFIFAVSATREMVDDIKRAKADAVLLIEFPLRV